MSATPYVMNLAERAPPGTELVDPPKKKMGRPVTSNRAKAIRARARRHQMKASEALAQLYKPIEEWDEEELARGRPRNKSGTFTGPVPQWIDREVHEKIVRRFEELVKTEMQVHTVAALVKLGELLGDEQVDSRGRPLVGASTKATIAQFLIEHILGKPKQRTETELSVKLQGILGMALVNPSELGDDFVPTAGSPELVGPAIEATSWDSVGLSELGDDDD